MKGLGKFPEAYFMKYKEKPVRLMDYNDSQLRISNAYVKLLKKLLINFDLDIAIRGSTLFKIKGKGEVEVGVYPNSKDWTAVIATLTKKFGNPENIEENYARFNSESDNKEVEIIVLKDFEADVDKKLHMYLLSHPDLLKKYVHIKEKYCFSKREYQRQKNNFLSEVIEMIPEE